MLKRFDSEPVVYLRDFNDNFLQRLMVQNIIFHLDSARNPEDDVLHTVDDFVHYLKSHYVKSDIVDELVSQIESLQKDGVEFISTGSSDAE